jgi:predicted NBD/HSP70 family sugar kinase
MTIDERQLEELARRLGARAGEKLDVDRTAREVVARLEREPARVVWWRRMPALQAVAAAAVVVLAVGVLTMGGGGNGVVDERLLPAPYTLQDLSVDELEEVFDSLIFEAPAFEVASATLEELSVEELEELLRIMED